MKDLQTQLEAALRQLTYTLVLSQEREKVFLNTTTRIEAQMLQEVRDNGIGCPEVDNQVRRELVCSVSPESVDFATGYILVEVQPCWPKDVDGEIEVLFRPARSHVIVHISKCSSAIQELYKKYVEGLSLKWDTKTLQRVQKNMKTLLEDLKESPVVSLVEEGKR
jgi:hypothetical protein